MALAGVVDGRYSIERELGRGGMATVYLARDLRHGNRVALKVLTADFASVVGGERFTREIRITAGLQHPHILPVFDSGQINGLPYYVMPFVDGPTVEQKIRLDGPMPVDDALEIAGEVADALRHAHAQGFVHRDIKPSNILLAHGHAVVADFGVARTVEVVSEQNLTRTGIAVGTAAYMSPEQAAGEKVDGRSDIYSLGCVLFELIAGHPPFTAATPRALMAMHWREEVPPLLSPSGPVRASVDALVRKSMSKSANDRFQNAGEMSAAIQRVSTEAKMYSAGFTPPEQVALFTAPVTLDDESGEKPNLAHEDPRTFASGLTGTIPASTRIDRAVAPIERSHKQRTKTLRTAVIGVAVLATIGAAAWNFSRSPVVALDHNRVVVYPLVVPADFRGSRSVGEDIGTMIGSALDGAGPLRWIDGWPLLAPALRNDIRNLVNDDARAIARARRAGYYLVGRIVSRGDSADVLLELNDVDGDSTVARGRASGLASDAWRTGLRAVNEILPKLIPSGSGDVNVLAGWNDRDPGAIASFLLAEAAFRRVHLGEALDRYRDALKADSTFALAAIRGAQAATWNHRASEASSFIDAALRQRLAPRYAFFARGYQAYLNGAADSAAAEFNRVIKLDPEMAAAWMQLGEVYTHLLPMVGNLDSLARVAFDEAHRLDPTAKSLLLHSIEIRMRNQEMTGLEPLVREFLAGEPDSVLAEQVDVMYNCARSGTRGVLWQQVTKAYPLAVLSAANSFKGAAARLGCAEAAFAAVATDTSTANAGRRWMSIVGLANTYLAYGRPGEARAQIDTAIAHGWGGGSYYLQAGPVYPSMRAAASDVARKDEATYGFNYALCPYNARLSQLGAWEATAGRPSVAIAIASDLARRALKSKLPADRRLARSAAAFAAIARGDTTRAIELLQRVVSEPVPSGDIVWDMSSPRGLERLLLARLLVARGDYRKATQVANVFDTAWPSIYLLYVPASLELRADAADKLSDNEMSAHFKNRLAALRGGRAVAGN